MKKFKFVALTLVTFFVSMNIISAACSAEEANKLNSLATNVRVSYEALEREIPIDDDFNLPDGLTEQEIAEYKRMEQFYRIYITNITEDLYVVVTDQIGGTKTYNYSDAKDGTITIDQTDRSIVNNYTIVVYSSNNTSCPNTRLYTTYVTTPLYNYYYESDVCTGIENFYLCKEFLSVPLVSYEEFVELATRYKDGQLNNDGSEKEEEKQEENGFKEFLKKNRNTIIAVSTIVIAAGVLVTVIIVKKQRSRIV